MDKKKGGAERPGLRSMESEPEPNTEGTLETPIASPIAESQSSLSSPTRRGTWQGRMDPRGVRFLTSEQIKELKRKEDESIAVAKERNLYSSLTNPEFNKFYKELKDSIKEEIEGIESQKKVSGKEASKKTAKKVGVAALESTLGLFFASFIPGAEVFTTTGVISEAVHKFGGKILDNPFQNENFKANLLIILFLYLLRDNINNEVNNGKNKAEKKIILSNKIKDIYAFLYDCFANEMELETDFMKEIFFDIYMDINGLKPIASSKKSKHKKKIKSKGKTKRKNIRKKTVRKHKIAKNRKFDLIK